LERKFYCSFNAAINSKESPIQPAAIAQPIKMVSGPKETANNRIILVVDDNKINRMLAKSILETRDYNGETLDVKKP